MEIIDINQAVSQINQLLEIAAEGKEIIITKNHQPMVKLISAQPQTKRPPFSGSDRDGISISDDFDEEDFRQRDISIDEWENQLLKFINSPLNSSLPPLSDEAISRENIYTREDETL